MTALGRINVAIAACITLAAFAVVTAQHRARTLTNELARAREVTHQLDVRYRELQIEQSTAANPAIVAATAQSRLGMRHPDLHQTRVLRQEAAQ